ncbi:MAG TPA: hypothetical protein VE174_05915 [Actinomycetota bacterium]|nr:hypothetical protein [Actinomycetota bacterium]
MVLIPTLNESNTIAQIARSMSSPRALSSVDVPAPHVPLLRTCPPPRGADHYDDYYSAE